MRCTWQQGLSHRYEIVQPVITATIAVRLIITELRLLGYSWTPAKLSATLSFQLLYLSVCWRGFHWRVKKFNLCWLIDSKSYFVFGSTTLATRKYSTQRKGNKFSFSFLFAVMRSLSSAGSAAPSLIKGGEDKQELGYWAVWSLSSAKAGFGIHQLRDDDFKVKLLLSLPNP